MSHACDGSEELGRTCIACNWCLGGMADGAFGCSINPASYRERMWGEDTFTRPRSRRRSWWSAADLADWRRRESRLCAGIGSRSSRHARHVGGALELWAALPGRDNYRNAIEWWAG